MSEPAVEQEVDEPVDESDEARIECWRLEVLIRAGYPFSVAEPIARSRCDLHVAVDLLHRGCDPELAARIVL